MTCLFFFSLSLYLNRAGRELGVCTSESKNKSPDLESLFWSNIPLLLNVETLFTQRNSQLIRYVCLLIELKSCGVGRIIMDESILFLSFFNFLKATPFHVRLSVTVTF